MQNVAEWQDDYCNHMAAVEDSTRVWLDTLAQHTKLQEDKATGQSPAEVRAPQRRTAVGVFHTCSMP